MKLRVSRDPGALFSLSSPWLHEDAPGLACLQGNTCKGVENNQENTAVLQLCTGRGLLLGEFLDFTMTLLLLLKKLFPCQEAEADFSRVEG